MSRYKGSNSKRARFSRGATDPTRDELIDLKARTGARGIFQTGSDEDEQTRNALAYYLGEPASRPSVDSGNYEPRTHYDLFEAYRGTNERLRSLVVRQIEEDDIFLITVVAPLERLEKATTIAWDKWVFEDGTLDVVAPEGVGRLMRSTFDEKTDTLTTYGKALLLDAQFWKTDMGKVHYASSLKQISNATVETACLQAAYALFGAEPRRFPGDRVNTTRVTSREALEDLLRLFIEQWGVLHKRVDGFPHIVDAMNEQIMSSPLRKRANVLVMPSGCETLIGRRPENWSLFSGMRRAVPRLHDLRKLLALVPETSIHTMPRLLTGNDQNRDDISMQERTIGGFNCAVYQEVCGGISLDEWRTRMMDIKVFDSSRDDWSPLVYADLLMRYSGIFYHDDNTGDWGVVDGFYQHAFRNEKQFGDFLAGTGMMDAFTEKLGKLNDNQLTDFASRFMHGNTFAPELSAEGKLAEENAFARTVGKGDSVVPGESLIPEDIYRAFIDKPSSSSSSAGSSLSLGGLPPSTEVKSASEAKRTTQKVVKWLSKWTNVASAVKPNDVDKFTMRLIGTSTAARQLPGGASVEAVFSGNLPAVADAIVESLQSGLLASGELDALNVDTAYDTIGSPILKRIGALFNPRDPAAASVEFADENEPMGRHVLNAIAGKNEKKVLFTSDLLGVASTGPQIPFVHTYRTIENQADPNSGLLLFKADPEHVFGQAALHEPAAVLPGILEDRDPSDESATAIAAVCMTAALWVASSVLFHGVNDKFIEKVSRACIVEANWQKDKKTTVKTVIGGHPNYQKARELLFNTTNGAPAVPMAHIYAWASPLVRACLEDIMPPDNAYRYTGSPADPPKLLWLHKLKAQGLANGSQQLKSWAKVIDEVLQWGAGNRSVYNPILDALHYTDIISYSRDLFPALLAKHYEAEAKSDGHFSVPSLISSAEESRKQEIRDSAQVQGQPEREMLAEFGDFSDEDNYIISRCAKRLYNQYPLLMQSLFRKHVIHPELFPDDPVTEKTRMNRIQFQRLMVLLENFFNEGRKEIQMQKKLSHTEREKREIELDLSLQNMFSMLYYAEPINLLTRLNERKQYAQLLNDSKKSRLEFLAEAANQSLTTAIKKTAAEFLGMTNALNQKFFEKLHAHVSWLKHALKKGSPPATRNNVSVSRAGELKGEDWKSIPPKSDSKPGREKAEKAEEVRAAFATGDDWKRFLRFVPVVECANMVKWFLDNNFPPLFNCFYYRSHQTHRMGSAAALRGYGESLKTFWGHANMMVGTDPMHKMFQGNFTIMMKTVPINPDGIAHAQDITFKQLVGGWKVRPWDPNDINDLSDYRQHKVHKKDIFVVAVPVNETSTEWLHDITGRLPPQLLVTPLDEKPHLSMLPVYARHWGWQHKPGVDPLNRSYYSDQPTRMMTYNTLCMRNSQFIFKYTGNGGGGLDTHVEGTHPCEPLHKGVAAIWRGNNAPYPPVRHGIPNGVTVVPS